MKLEDVLIAALIAAGVFAFVVRRARGSLGREVGYVPTGFQWDEQLGGYTKLGNDGVTYVHYV